MEKKNEEMQDSFEDVKKPKYRGIKVMPYIIGNETCEKLGTIGTQSNLVVYLTSVFNLKGVTATTIVNVFLGTCNLAPLFGAYLCDAHFGRYKTLGVASVSSFTGMFILMLTAAITKFHPPHCEAGAHCVGPTTWQIAILLSGFAFLVVGAGGIRPCNLAFGADQFNPETESGKRGINSFFNWYYFTYTFAMMVSVTLIVYIQSNINWAIGLGIPCFLMFLSCAFFFVGTRLYVKVLPEGSPLTGVVQVFVAAAKKRHLKHPEKPQLSLFNYQPVNSINSKLLYTNQFTFLDKAAICTPEDGTNPNGSPIDPWKLKGMQQVEEVKCIMRVIPIWSAGIIYYSAIVQQNTYAVLQALQSDRKLGGQDGFSIPGASYIVFTMVGLTAWIPIYDRVIVPQLRKITGKEGGISMLQRIGIGFFLGIVTMFVSALVETRRKDYAFSRPTLGIANGGGAISSMSGFWLLPQLLLAGLTEAFGTIGQVEFFYKQFPENMRSIAASFLFAGMAGASYLSGFMVTLVHHITKTPSGGNWLPEDLNKGKLDYFYYLFAGLGIINFGYFLVCSKWYRYKGTGGVVIEMVDDSEVDEKHIV